MKGYKVLGLAAMLVVAVSWGAEAQVGSWGVGGFANYNVPFFGLGDWYDAGGKWGLTASYVPAEHVVVEAEYHRANFKDGNLKDLTFTWSDGKAYTSPNAMNDMSLNSFVVNGLVRLAQRGGEFKASSFTPYIAVGGGFYRYENKVSGMLWPGQTGSLTMELPATVDKRFGVGFNAGLGVQAFVMNNVAVDLRARYNMIIGQLRPMEDWGLQETFPLQLLDIGAGIKFYFSGE